MDWRGDTSNANKQSDTDLRDAEAHMQLIVWIAAGCFVAVAFVASTTLIRGHIAHFTHPIIQRKIVGILWMVPIYAVDSWLSLRFKDIALYLDLMRDSYEGYVIYLFLALMIAYLGNGSDEKIIQILRNLPDLPHPFPLGYCCAPIPLGAKFLRDCKLATMQFVVLKPLMALVAIALELNGVYCEGTFTLSSGYLYTSLIVNASITYAFYYLVLFFLALRTELAPFTPFPKFLCIKAVLFLSFWQSVVLAFLSRFAIITDVGSWSVEDVTTGINNLLICCEMAVVAIAHHHAFPYAPYAIGPAAVVVADMNAASSKRNLLADHLAFDDAMRDFNEVMPVVLPTQFTPNAQSFKGKETLARHSSQDLFAPPERASLLGGDDYDAERGGSDGNNRDSRHSGRGWKL